MPKNQAMPTEDTPPLADDPAQIVPKDKGSESGGGAYPNPHTGCGEKGDDGRPGPKPDRSNVGDNAS